MDKILQRKQKISKNFTKVGGILSRTDNLLEQTPAAQVHFIKPRDPAVGLVDHDSDFTSYLPTDLASTDTST